MSAKFNFFVEAPPNSMLKVRTEPKRLSDSNNFFQFGDKFQNFVTLMAGGDGA